jgi:hypothetical protein
VEFLDIYQRVPGLVLGFHGCDRAVGEAVLADSRRHLNKSQNAYDWLGGGIYFWENDPQRAMEFAQAAKGKPHLTRGRIEDPFVVGAVIDLGLCCNLLDRRALTELASSFAVLEALSSVSGNKLPGNGGKRTLRHLDCLVIENMHKMRAEEGIAKYDTVRGAIWEGDPVFPDSAIQAHNHIQIAVRSGECIKGYFRPRQPQV